MKPVRELTPATRPSKTHEVELGDIIKTNGFAFKVIPSKKVTTSMTRIPAFKAVDGSEKVVIWVCPSCNNMIQDEDMETVKDAHETCPFVGCDGFIKDYKKEEV